MIETYIVKITSQAEEQMQEISHYITHELKSPDVALIAVIYSKRNQLQQLSNMDME